MYQELFATAIDGRCRDRIQWVYGASIRLSGYIDESNIVQCGQDALYWPMQDTVA